MAFEETPDTELIELGISKPLIGMWDWRPSLGTNVSAKIAEEGFSSIPLLETEAPFQGQPR